MNHPDHNQQHVFQTLETGPYKEQMLLSEEKFSIWESKSFSERQSVFKRVSTLGQFPKDLLSNWISEQMDILLEKSVLGSI